MDWMQLYWSWKLLRQDWAGDGCSGTGDILFGAHDTSFAMMWPRWCSYDGVAIVLRCHWHSYDDTVVILA